MPKVVDHDQRRRQIATAVSAIAAEHGLSDISFREVATRAGVSVSLVQHYFGDKANLLKTTLEIQSEAMNVYVAERVAQLGSNPDPATLLRTVARAFLPLDDVSRRSMLVYHGFAAAALTDPDLRDSGMFTNGRALISFFVVQLTNIAEGGAARRIDPNTEATVLLSLLLGLSIAVLLEQTSPTDALSALDAHLGRLDN